MSYSFPHTIESPFGEKLTFTGIHTEPDGDVLVGENFVQPGSGPPMHTHWLQDEGFTVLAGQMGYQMAGQPMRYAQAGESVLFKRGTPHRFWNAGQDVLHCKGWMQPANTTVFFLSSVFAAQHKSGTPQPELFDAAYLLTRYSSEYEMNDIPFFVRKVVLPVVYRLGQLLNRYNHFKDAPEPVKPLRSVV